MTFFSINIEYNAKGILGKFKFIKDSGRYVFGVRVGFCVSNKVCLKGFHSPQQIARCGFVLSRPGKSGLPKVNFISLSLRNSFEFWRVLLSLPTVKKDPAVLDQTDFLSLLSILQTLFLE